MSEKNELEKNKKLEISSTFDSWLHAKSLAMVLMSGAIAIRLYESKIAITMDTATLLSILLALFSVVLSAMFYFKATDTSNKFYDNSYKYTKDVAELLVKIESGFGERLKNLDEGYTSMRDQMQNVTSHEHIIQQTKVNVKAEQDDIAKIKHEKDELLKKLFESSELRKEEKDKLAQELNARDNELKESHRELARLNKRLFVERLEKREASDDSSDLKLRVRNFTLSDVFPRIPNSSGLSVRNLSSEFENILHTLPHEYINDLISLEYINSDRLTRRGRLFLQILVRNQHRL